MQQTTFDENGYLVPYDIIEMNLADFETHFAITQQRKFLFERLQNFLIDLVKLLKSPFKLWINGSFTTKKTVPNDIDLVVFVNDNVYFYCETELLSMKRAYKLLGLDVHLIVVYPFSHKFRFETDFDTHSYFDLFSSDRKSVKKGFIQLK